MPANNVDLTALLPVLKDAIAPFEAATAVMQRLKLNPNSTVRSFAPLAGLHLSDVLKLVESVQAVRRVAGDLP